MSTYTFKYKKNDSNKYDISDITFEVVSESRTDIIEEFVKFLQAVGFSVEELKEQLDIE